MERNPGRTLRVGSEHMFRKESRMTTEFNVKTSEDKTPKIRTILNKSTILPFNFFLFLGRKRTETTIQVLTPDRGKFHG
jgi:hypothetical protein